jgi:hypothetical protein
MPEPPDRRAAQRYPVNTDTSCSFLSPVVEDLGPVQLRDISMAGIGLQLRRRVEVGSLLALTLVNPARSFNKTVLVQVAHVTPSLNGFLVGGNFREPLTYQEMSSLVL